VKQSVSQPEKKIFEKKAPPKPEKSWRERKAEPKDPKEANYSAFATKKKQEPPKNRYDVLG
jgi:hypothetical protein